MRLIVLFICLPILVLATPPDHKGRIAGYLNAYVATRGTVPTDFNKVYAFLDKLESKSGRADQKFIHQIFKKTHQHILKSFRDDASFGDIIENGEYNCLTATALYALIMDYFDISYTIVETNYHIFLTVEASDGIVLLETTDPVAGFISSPRQIDNKISGYKLNTFPNDNPAKYFSLEASLYNEVTLDQLVGLLHYNLAIASYNKGNSEQAVNHLEQASQFYYSVRTKEFSKLLLLHLVKTGDLSNQKLVRRITAMNNQARNAILATSKTF